MSFQRIGQSYEQPRAKNLSEDGRSVGGGMSVGTRQPTSEIGEWLGNQSPADMDKAAVSRALSHGVTLAVRYEGRYPSGPNGERLPSYQVAAGCNIDGTDDQRAAALADLRNFLAPASIRQIEIWLAELSLITAGRGKEGFDAELFVTAYSSRLSQYPADVVRHALTIKTWKWFPTWDELESVCKAKTGPRKHMIAALSKPAPDPEPKRRPPTQDERDRIAALVAEQFPNVPQGWRDRAVDAATKGDCMEDAQ